MIEPGARTGRIAGGGTGAAPAKAPTCWLELDHQFLHDFAGPAGRIASVAELIARKYRDHLDHEGQELFTLFLESATRLRALVFGLETYARILGSPEVFRSCRASDLVAGALASIRAEMRDAVDIRHDTLPEVHCDAAQLIFVFACLLENSMKFRSEKPPTVHISAKPLESEWLFSLSDNGIGIELCDVDRIFGMFRRLNGDEYPGCGVGLAIARQIVQRHGGRIWCEPQSDVGTTFCFTLPMSGPSALATMARPAETSAAGI